MKIKQSFIDRCGEITVNQIKEIATVFDYGAVDVSMVLLNPVKYSEAIGILKATANVLKISLSDIYEVEQLPNTLTE